MNANPKPDHETLREHGPLLALKGIKKRFGEQVALDEVDFALARGEVHVLFGENGAGKSTLINCIVGTFPPDAGTYALRGETIQSLTPAEARRRGIAIVFQEFSLVPQLSVEDNLFLGRELGEHLLDRRAMRAAATAHLKSLGFPIDVRARISSLSRAQKQMVEIAKALLVKPSVLILDEPTASLTEAETQALFRVIADLKKSGIGIIYVSHRMQEIRALADRVTVLRNGRHIATIAAADASDEELVTLMSGRPPDRLFPKVAYRPGAKRLEVSGLAVAAEDVQQAEIVLRAGEIVGLGGLIGSGKSPFVRALFGLEPLAAGEIRIDGALVEAPTPRRMLERGVCYFPADRATEGLALQRAIRENVSMVGLSLPEFSRGPRLRLASERARVSAIAERLKLRPLEIERTAGALSGGNKQKVVLARGLARKTDVFLLEEPTVGIDVNAKLEVYELMRAVVEEGGAVLLVSSDLHELLHMSHRLYVFAEGRIVAELEGGEVTEEKVLTHFFAKPVSGAVRQEVAV
jgi:ribose transport system ATP-binding protein